MTTRWLLRVVALMIAVPACAFIFGCLYWMIFFAVVMDYALYGEPMRPRLTMLREHFVESCRMARRDVLGA